MPPTLSECIQALLTAHDKVVRALATEALNDMLSNPNTTMDVTKAICQQYISQVDPNTLQLSGEGFVAVTFVTDYVKRLSGAAFANGNGDVVGMLVECLLGLVYEMDTQMEQQGIGACQSAEAIVAFKGVHTCRKLGDLLGVLLRTFPRGINTVQGLVNRCASDAPARTATLVGLHTILRSLSEKPLGKKAFLAACDMLGSRVMQFLSASFDQRRLDWVLYILKFAARAIPRMSTAGDHGEARNTVISSVCGYLQSGLSNPQSVVAVPRVVEYLLKIIQRTVGDCDGLGTLDLHEVLHVLLAVLASPCSLKTFKRTAAILEMVISFEDSNGACASALRAVFVDSVHAVDILTHLVTRYMQEGESADQYNGQSSLEVSPEARQRLLASWSSNPEDFILSVPEGDNSIDVIAEGLLVALTQCTSAASNDDSPLFVSAAWTVINNLLTGSQNTDMGRVLAYRIIGLCCYSISQGQEENYKGFFYSTLLPDCANTSHPRVQRRAIWAVGMWCECADDAMRSRVFSSMLQLLTSGDVSPVVVLTVLKTIEHFMNDGSFTIETLPEGFGPAILGGLSTILPHVRQPYTVKDLASLILIVIERVPGAKGSGSVGDAVVEMLTPTVRGFITEMTSSNCSSGGGGDMSGFGDEDDKEGQQVSCMLTVIEVLQIALWSASDASKWGDASPLLPLAKFIVDPESPGSAQLEEEGWSLLEVLIKSTSPESSNAINSVVQVFEFACMQLGRDFESKGVCVQVICGCLVLMAAAGHQPSPSTNSHIQSLVAFCQRELTHIHEQSIDSSLPGSVGLLTLCLAFVLVESSRPMLFQAAVGSLMGIEDALVDASYHAPVVATVVSALALHEVQRGQPVPADFSARLSAIHDVTTSGWGSFIIMRMAEYTAANLILPGGEEERELLQSLVESGGAAMTFMLESGEVDPAGVGSMLELLGDGTINPTSTFAAILKGRFQQASILN